ncbi:hypothetical protein PEPS_47830 (plasmid) [Persicobacter psychrovividus]|uniref:Uncharacterized protein n=1 Tax=Persicobacter psychrovividus TaxID=387638 RepID=A0ABM7VNB1_9BACT|nr:hypothetical protein PEPS_47830 [Persicobacter psychrovividus]
MTDLQLCGTYPLVNREVAIAFYNDSKSIYKDEELLKTKFHIEMGLTIDQAVKDHIFLNNKKVIDWDRKSDIIGSKLILGI